MKPRATAEGAERGGGAASPPRVELEAVTVRFDELEAVREVSLDVQPGERVAVIGPSGCGKSTLLRVLGGLVEPSAGSVRVGDLAPVEFRRSSGCGFLFQTPLMLSWLDVLDNVALAGRLVGTDRTERYARARDWIGRVGLAGFERYRPHQISGGMRQRAALARSLSLSPPLLLMDEPFGALDEITRHRMIFELLDVLQGTSATLLLVTHSIEEAVLVSDRILIMTSRPGTITAVLETVIPHPRTPAVRGSEEYLRRVGELRQLIEVNGHAG